jgi:7-carboxy-7-deazaguanine synthase
MDGDMLRISEIFHSIQGESTWAGHPCVFIRLAGCHLRCAYCDTEYAFRGGDTQSIDAILCEVSSYPANLVEITGGEPLLQKRVHGLISKLCDLGKTVLIETSGTCDIRACDPRAIRIMDIKTPGSGESESNLLENLSHLHERDEVKFVITTREDYEWARDIIEHQKLPDRCRAVLMSPVFEQPEGAEIPGMPALAPRELAEWILQDGLRVRLQLQLHKYIWDPQTRGV